MKVPHNLSIEAMEVHIVDDTGTTRLKFYISDLYDEMWRKWDFQPGAILLDFKDHTVSITGADMWRFLYSL